MTDISAAIPAVGEPAPTFQLPDDSGTIRDLAAERGRWVVLFFYPNDFTAGCTTEVCEFRDRSAEFEAAGATVWSVSVLDAASKARFKAEQGLNFPLLADVDHAVAERYGVWVEKHNHGKVYHGIARSTFLIDPEGRIAHVWPAVKVEGHAAEVLATLSAATAQRAATARR
ncbi:MAG: peroxiredoxin [Candidatus Limnocylindrales bacterium]